MHFVIFVLWPTLFARVLIYLKFRNANFVQMQNFLFFLKVYQSVSYGTWAIYNISQIIGLPRGSHCDTKHTRELLDLNYEILIIFGVLPALICVFALLIGVCCAPYLIYLAYQSHRRANSQLEATRNLIN